MNMALEEMEGIYLLGYLFVTQVAKLSKITGYGRSPLTLVSVSSLGPCNPGNERQMDGRSSNSIIVIFVIILGERDICHDKPRTLMYTRRSNAIGAIPSRESRVHL